MVDENRTFWHANHVHLDPLMKVTLCPTQAKMAGITFSKGYQYADILSVYSPGGGMDLSDVIHLFWKEGQLVTNDIYNS